MSDKMQADFQPWHGDRPFRGDKLLRVKFRNGRVSKDALPASKWRGKWGEPFPDGWDFDVVGVQPQ
ncbi:hypothetical protein GGR43_004043 [Sphingobium jiangsuense]|uniref:Uncharacterized protein n=1 Tax=Sphingobium jiangsuense TaxID=870476 RepID=A0A7W6BQC2_9SPHN|nr:hypothetical protein [Sphingobium jiangsuense]MBB3927847.1 hypothetical protein [Sphingobium jiangsuense]MBB3928299.1 hypothetical protein [Sphingobium jiangsuense]